MFETPVLRHIFSACRRLRERTGLPVSGILAVIAGLVALAATLAVLAATTEDVTRHNGLASADPTRLRWIVDHRPSSVVTVARYTSQAGGPLSLALVVCVAAAALWLTRHRLLLALAPALAFGLAGTTAALAKSVVGRARPPVSLHLVAESDSSFPSGHSTESTAVFVTLALVVAVFVLRKPIARCATVLVAGALSFAVGCSRLVLGVHWPSDVIAGWALGLSIALVVTIVAGLVVEIVPKRPAATGMSAKLARLAIAARRQGRLEAA
jgi:membrane-associated phospholipid phosphatase